MEQHAIELQQRATTALANGLNEGPRLAGIGGKQWNGGFSDHRYTP
jgi:hypothetical protein